MLLGCIADDFTGATDLANTLVGQGMAAIQVIGVPDVAFDCPAADAVVVALKSRTAPVAEAVSQSLEALAWLRAREARQVFFKYCSTFDSTEKGNIGPVADALLDALATDFSIACPAFPTNGRTVFQGHLFVGQQLLSDSGMKDHPLTPMRDANLVRVLAKQSSRSVGLVEQSTVALGAAAIQSRFEKLRSSGQGYAIVDAISDRDLLAIGAASADLELVTGGSGIALGLPENFRRQGALGQAEPAGLPNITGKSAVLAGSCSNATRAQVELAKKAWPAFTIDPAAVAEGRDVAADALDWAAAQPSGSPVLITSSAAPDEVARLQDRYGQEATGAMIEATHAAIASGLVATGVGRLIVAGGETSGAVVQALQIPALRICREIDPGVPWTETLGTRHLALALKSGNFGAEDFFTKAFGMLP